jgi:uncharacterized membrane protein
MKFVLIVVIGSLLCPSYSWANLKFCNQTGTYAMVAVAYQQKDAAGVSTGNSRGVIVEGWWRFEPGECASVTDIDNASGYWIYYHAHSPNRTWRGPSLLCVYPKPFKTVGDFMRAGDTCVAGRHLEGFQRSNANAKNYTINLRVQ